MAGRESSFRSGGTVRKSAGNVRFCRRDIVTLTFLVQARFNSGTSEAKLGSIPPHAAYKLVGLPINGLPTTGAQESRLDTGTDAGHHPERMVAVGAFGVVIAVGMAVVQRHQAMPIAERGAAGRSPLIALDGY